jgi:hypothetical protein
VLYALHPIFLDLISPIIRLTFIKYVYCGRLSGSKGSLELDPLIGTKEMLGLAVDYTAEVR